MPLINENEIHHSIHFNTKYSTRLPTYTIPLTIVEGFHVGCFVATANGNKYVIADIVMSDNEVWWAAIVPMSRPLCMYTARLCELSKIDINFDSPGFQHTVTQSPK